MQYSVIRKSQLEGAKRLDAEYYQPEYLGVRKLLASSSRLLDVSRKITDFGAYSQMNFVEYADFGVRFLRNQDVGEFFIDDSDPVFISDDTYRKLSLKLEEYDIITPRVGTLGNAAVVFKDHLPASANQNLAQIKPDQDKINPLYLAIFLSSRFGQAQFEWLATGNVQPWLNLSQINSIKVFVPNFKVQQEIAEVAVQALEAYRESKSLYSQAEKMLLEELGLEDFEADEELWNVVNLSEVRAAGRMDAEYFQPKYEKLLKRLGLNARRLADIARKTKRRPEIIGNKEYSYTEISDLNTGSGEVTCSVVIGRELPANANIIVKGEELIISKVRPTRGAVATISKEWKKDHIVSGAFTVFEIESPMREYLLVVLRSVIGRLQMEKPTTGTSYPTITDVDVENVLIPILPEKTRQKIAELVRQSHEARAKAKHLLEDAKRKVEELIESKSI